MTDEEMKRLKDLGDKTNRELKIWLWFAGGLGALLFVTEVSIGRNPHGLWPVVVDAIGAAMIAFFIGGLGGSAIIAHGGPAWARGLGGAFAFFVCVLLAVGYAGGDLLALVRRFTE
jgi:hypothetical protein